MNTFLFYCTRALSLQKKYLEAIQHSGFPLMDEVFSISLLMTPWSVSITFCSMELLMTRTCTRKSKAWDTQRYYNIPLKYKYCRVLPILHKNASVHEVFKQICILHYFTASVAWLQFRWKCQTRLKFKQAFA